MYFLEYLKIVTHLFHGSPRDKERLVFTFYDYNKDGYLNSLDILNLIENLDKSGAIYKEVKVCSSYYINETMIVRHKMS